MCFFAILVPSLVKCLFTSFAHILLTCLLLSLAPESFFRVPNTRPVSDVSARDFLCSVWAAEGRDPWVAGRVLPVHSPTATVPDAATAASRVSSCPARQPAPLPLEWTRRPRSEMRSP